MNLQSLAHTEHADVCFVFPEEYGFFPEIVEYAKHLRQQGYACAYVGVCDKVNNYVDRHGVNVHHVAGAWQHSLGAQRRNSALAEGIVEYLAKIRPTIVHVFHFRGCARLVTMARNRLGATKWICDVRTVNVQGQFGWIKDQITHVETLFYDEVVALTTEIARAMSPARHPVTVIPMGVSVERFQGIGNREHRRNVRRALGIPEDDTVILYAGTLAPQRKLDRLIQAYGMLLERAKESSKLCLVMVGGSITADDPDRRHLENWCKRLKLHERVRFVGRVPFETVNRYFAAADIGVSAVPMDRHYMHQPPTKLLEYFATGTIIPVCTATPASLALACEGENAFVCSDSSEGIAAALERAVVCHRDSRARSIMLSKAVETVRDFDWRLLVSRQLQPLYMKIRTAGETRGR